MRDVWRKFVVMAATHLHVGDTPLSKGVALWLDSLPAGRSVLRKQGGHVRMEDIMQSKAILGTAVVAFTSALAGNADAATP